MLSNDELRDRAVRFYNRYGSDLDQIKSILEIRLSQLALAYTIHNKLPPESIRVSARVKSLSSFLKKLERKGWPQFYYPTEVAGDLVGARVVCWFVDDCHSFLELIRTSEHLRLEEEVEDYIKNPKATGYRSLHVNGVVEYDSVKRHGNGVRVEADSLKCEIQIRTKLQDSWGDITHEFHYKAKELGVEDDNLEGFLSDVSSRLANEDSTLVKFRDAYQQMAEQKLADETREGFREA